MTTGNLCFADETGTGLKTVHKASIYAASCPQEEEQRRKERRGEARRAGGRQSKAQGDWRHRLG